MERRLNVAILRSGGIGDVVLSTACLSYVSNHPRVSKIYWLGKEPAASLIRDSFPSAIVLDIRGGRLWFQDIKKSLGEISQLDMILDLQRSGSSVLISLILCIARGAKYYTWNKRSIARSVQVLRALLRRRNDSRVVTKSEKKNLRFIGMLNVAKNAIPSETAQAVEVRPSIPITSQPTTLGISKGEWIAISFDALHASKRAPIGKFLLHPAIKRLLAKFNHVFLGTESAMQETILYINSAVEKENVLNLVGKTTLVEAAKVLAQCKFALTNDSALAHMAEAVGTPAGVFFGPTIESFGYEPTLKGSASFSVPLGCRPCTKGGRKACRYGDYKCFHAIETSQILDFIAVNSERDRRG